MSKIKYNGQDINFRRVDNVLNLNNGVIVELSKENLHKWKESRKGTRFETFVTGKEGTRDKVSISVAFFEKMALGE